MKHINLKIHGMVQGVFFRASTKTTADELGVKGFVRNEPDGRVYIEAEADDETLNKFVAWCQHGPRTAHVEHIEMMEGTITGFSDFSIKR